MPLNIGDQLNFADAAGTIRAVTNTTDEDGRGTVTYAGNTFSFRALKATVDGTDYPLVAASDAVFRVGVLQQDADPALFCLVLDDGPAPWGWGRSVVGVAGTWAEASEYAAEDSGVFTMGWAPGEITIKKGGVLEAGVYADLVFTYSTSDGAHDAWWQPAYPSKAGATWGAATGRFQTDVDGVLWDVTTGTLQPIIVPRGFGALGYRSTETDGWTDCPDAERLLTEVEVWYLQESAPVSEGASTTLNVASCELTVTGPVGAQIIAYWEGAQRRAAHTIPIGGSRTLTGLPPGEYAVAAFHPTDTTKEVPRGSTTLAANGGTGTVALGSWVDHSADSVILVRAYLDGSADRAVGAAVWKRRGTPSVWEQAGTTDANGEVTVSMTGGVTQIRIIDDRGCAVTTQVLSAGEVWDPQITFRIGVCRSATWSPQPAYTEGLLPWGNAGVHPNLELGGPPAYMQNESSGDQYQFADASLGNGYVSEPLPHTVLDLSGTTIPASALQSYSLYDMDDTLISSGWEMWPVADPPWTPASPSWWENLTEGRPVYGAVGGKIVGNVVEASRGDLVTVDNLREAARVGIETGRFVPLEIRSASATADEE
jgi:hypothetical protein